MFQRCLRAAAVGNGVLRRAARTCSILRMEEGQVHSDRVGPVGD